MPAGRLGWVARLLLRVGADAEVLAPPELAEELRRLALRTLARYGG
jgi:predicted DNA-binding transcriptional regulator YafY